MMDDPGCMDGRLISFKPQRLPDDSHRKSLKNLRALYRSQFHEIRTHTKLKERYSSACDMAMT
jgi:hypothetical protein